ncbi:uroporphyrinogen-III C-methyltransferase [Gordonia sp. ABSL11-1]|uniref:uroporphyrinogen-III C-methyltransferase n=1 Tax=Gordonia sp. ABSL11-1 TaxID=3053924 RepID=UPI002574031F|nr:uroporphyrinogen-III C-methyltransferase [Gordonia sp. ABSL11-1]MDL9948489.1 uroporphyrinogen-III C-methyltransferase [Gordonia sp. ABSL11-1]
MDRSDSGAVGVVTARTADVGATYRAALPVAGRRVAVFGSGGPALRHASALLNAGAVVTVVGTSVTPALADLAARDLIGWCDRDFRAADLDEIWLAVAATGNELVDRAIADACSNRRLWCLRDNGPSRRAGGAGRVVLVGGGPGDPGLLTVAGSEALRSADVIVTDRLAPLSVLADLPGHVEIIDVGKIPFGRAAAQEDINRILIERASQGRIVVRFKGGDSFLFGRGGEELLACEAAGIPVSVIPGVSSALAVPAAAGIPVTHRGLTQGVTVVSGHVPPDHRSSTVDYRALAAAGTTLVFLMAVTNLDAITTALIGHGMAPDTPAACIADGTLRTQRVVRSDLRGIAAEVADHGMKPPAITVVGAVSRLSEQQLASTYSDGGSVVGHRGLDV